MLKNDNDSIIEEQKQKTTEQDSIDVHEANNAIIGVQKVIKTTNNLLSRIPYSNDHITISKKNDFSMNIIHESQKELRCNSDSEIVESVEMSISTEKKPNLNFNFKDDFRKRQNSLKLPTSNSGDVVIPLYISSYHSTLQPHSTSTLTPLPVLELEKEESGEDKSEESNKGKEINPLEVMEEIQNEIIHKLKSMKFNRIIEEGRENNKKLAENFPKEKAVLNRSKSRKSCIPNNNNKIYRPSLSNARISSFSDIRNGTMIDDLTSRFIETKTQPRKISIDQNVSFNEFKKNSDYTIGLADTPKN